MERCYWCEGTEDLETFPNTLDFDPARDSAPSLMTLCRLCLASVGIDLTEPDACSEHRSGCGAGAHAAPGYAQRAVPA